MEQYILNCPIPHAYTPPPHTSHESHHCLLYTRSESTRSYPPSIFYLPALYALPLSPPHPVSVSTCRYVGYSRDRFQNTREGKPNAVDAATPCLPPYPIFYPFVAACFILFHFQVPVLMLMVPFWQGIVRRKKVRETSCLFVAVWLCPCFRPGIS